MPELVEMLMPQQILQNKEPPVVVNLVDVSIVYCEGNHLPVLFQKRILKNVSAWFYLLISELGFGLKGGQEGKVQLGPALLLADDYVVQQALPPVTSYLVEVLAGLQDHQIRDYFVSYLFLFFVKKFQFDIGLVDPLQYLA